MKITFPKKFSTFSSHMIKHRWWGHTPEFLACFKTDWEYIKGNTYGENSLHMLPCIKKFAKKHHLSANHVLSSLIETYKKTR